MHTLFRSSRFLAFPAALALFGAASVPSLPTPPGAVTIFNPGAGDYAGFRIVIEPGGHAAAVDGAGRATAEIQYELVDRFFTDLAAAPPSHDVRCAAQSSSNFDDDPSGNVDIGWKDRSWHDPGCSADDRVVQLSRDAKAIANALYVRAYRVRPMYVYVGNAAGYGPQKGYGASAPVAYGAQPFSSGSSTITNPYTGLPSGTVPYASLPVVNVYPNLPFSSLPGSSPFTGLPLSNLPSISPYSGGPFTGLPYGSL